MKFSSIGYAQTDPCNARDKTPPFVSFVSLWFNPTPSTPEKQPEKALKG
ncbi:hypothetical protein PN462_06825 [Spirulina sp. CS-785/01]|nr:hypothetical protein [Spirulina sp. CS-785/01]